MNEDVNDKLINRYKEYFNIKHIKVKYNGIFWRSKALNHSVSYASGKYITVLDIDSLITKFFLPGITEFYSSYDNEDIKLAHRVFYISIEKIKVAMFGIYDEKFIDGLIEKYYKYKIESEIYTKLEIAESNYKKIDKNWLKSKALGNSHYTMLKVVFLELGGYDERFKGWGHEDSDFNRRVYMFLKKSRLRENQENEIFNITNRKYDKNYKSRSVIERNMKIYKENKENNVIKIDKGTNWGKFEE